MPTDIPEKYAFEVTREEAQRLYLQQRPIEKERGLSCLYAKTPPRSPQGQNTVRARQPKNWAKGTVFYTTHQFINNIPKE